MNDVRAILSCAPLLRLLIPFLAGIFVQLRLDFFIPPVFVTVYAVSLGVFFYLLKFLKPIRRQYISTFFLHLFLFIAGCCVAFFHTESFRPCYVSLLPEKEQIIRVRIVTSVLEKSKSFKATGEVLSIHSAKGWNCIQGHVLCRFEKCKMARQILYGDELILITKLTALPQPMNPGMFDYGAYLRDRQISRQFYADSTHWCFFLHDKGNAIIQLCQRWRMSLLHLMKQNKVEGSNFAVGAALLLGYEDQLDPDLLNAYTGAGVLHVLSVSGMHVALVYFLIQSALFFLDPYKYGRILKAIVLLSFLWFYAALTGLSPPVMRSAAMFSFVIVGGLFSRQAPILNTLAASVFFLVMIDPYMILDAGFQLSYLSVAGIVLFHPVISTLWKPGNWLLDKGWGLLSVSIAAQAATFPLGLYYFHQFPVYFLITNLVVIPLSSAVIYAGIALLVLNMIPAAGMACGLLFSFLLRSLNKSVAYFSSWPGASISGVFISSWETLALYILVLITAVYIGRPRLDNLRMLLIAFIGYFSWQCISGWEHNHKKQVIVYNVPRHTALDFMEGCQHHFTSDTGLVHQPGLCNFFLTPSRQLFCQTRETAHPFSNHHTIYNWQGKQFLICSGKQSLSIHFKTDYLVIGHGADMRKAIDTRRLVFRKLIIDASCSKKETARWKKFIRELELDAWIVAEQGAYVEEIR